MAGAQNYHNVKMVSLIFFCLKKILSGCCTSSQCEAAEQLLFSTVGAPAHLNRPPCNFSSVCLYKNIVKKVEVSIKKKKKEWRAAVLAGGNGAGLEQLRVYPCLGSHSLARTAPVREGAGKQALGLLCLLAAPHKPWDAFPCLGMQSC